MECVTFDPATFHLSDFNPILILTPPLILTLILNANPNPLDLKPNLTLTTKNAKPKDQMSDDKFPWFCFNRSAQHCRGTIHSCSKL